MKIVSFKCWNCNAFVRLLWLWYFVHIFFFLTLGIMPNTLQLFWMNTNWKNNVMTMICSSQKRIGKLWTAKNCVFWFFWGKCVISVAMVFIWIFACFGFVFFFLSLVWGFYADNHHQTYRQRSDSGSPFGLLSSAALLSIATTKWQMIWSFFPFVAAAVHSFK